MAIESNDTNLTDLLKLVETGKAQLPDFQRSWVWDDSQIRKLIESIISGYPMGAGMFLQTGGDSVRFSHRLFEGVDSSVKAEPEYLVLDGQQRLTTLFQVFSNKKPVITRLANSRNNEIKRYYYLDIAKSLDPDCDRLDAIISVPETKILTENIGRDIKLDLRSREDEFANKMFPLNITFDLAANQRWMLDYISYYSSDPSISLKVTQQFIDFQKNILNVINLYKIPIIKLSKDTSKEAVCQIFENVNTGGVALTVFELVTATFSADDFKLREDWENIHNELVKHNELLQEVDATAFLSAITLLSTYRKSLIPVLNKDKQIATACKRKDILKLELSDYKECRDNLVIGFKKAADFLIHQGIFTRRDLPYSTQLIPLAAIHAYAEEKNIDLKRQKDKSILSKWYWCGVFGELYGAANETRYVLDMVEVIKQIKGEAIIPDTVSRASFQATRLLSMRTRNSAAYKGVMALILQDQPLDFMSANKMDLATYISESTDIHHIFPQSYCIKHNLPEEKWNSVINKTPIYASTNRSIGGRAPSEYLLTIRKNISEDAMIEAIASHKINFNLLASDSFDDFIADRAKRLCDLIEKAMGKSVSGRDTEETINLFGIPLKNREKETEIKESGEISIDNPNDFQLSQSIINIGAQINDSYPYDQMRINFFQSTETLDFIYKASKEIYEKHRDINSYYEKVKIFGINWGSFRGWFVPAFRCMREGIILKGSISQKLSKYYLSKIAQDYGREGLMLALKSFKQTVEYYESLGQNKPGDRAILKEFQNRLKSM